MTNDSTTTAIIEVTIPMHCLDSDDDLEECGICYTMCCSKECSMYEQQTACCDQTICSGCLVKMCIRCRCTSNCEQIICICPFCRDMTVVTSVALFHARKDVCADCKQSAVPLVETATTATTTELN